MCYLPKRSLELRHWFGGVRFIEPRLIGLVAKSRESSWIFQLECCHYLGAAFRMSSNGGKYG